ncbi:alginate O-acetyltransferase AlgX-related protein [Sphingobium yanoikuyae]|uniref:alginate O-acetyltransferase AlgX-related protein n=1 Tax=Sphingobium yanoikuyae TaxID=13690 RepID=UPI0028A998CA|nr:hypothetical protein [Sphingobium yanoikuyae]
MSSAQLTRQAEMAASVIVGKSGNLFHRDHYAIDQLTGAAHFTPEEVEFWRNSVETRWAWCKANGIAFRMVIIPEKHVVLAHDLPDDVEISEDRPAIQLMQALSPDVAKDCFYPLDLLRAQYDYPTYYRTDTHFTMYGGYLVYQQLMDSLKDVLDLTPVGVDDIELKPRPYTGDLGVRMEPEQEETVDFVSHKTFLPATRLFDNKRFTRGHTAVYQSERDQAPRCLLIRDSFSNYLVPHFIPVFSRTTAIGSISMHYDLVRHERPDVLIFQIAERFLGNFDGEGLRIMPADMGPTTFEEYSGVALDALP